MAQDPPAQDQMHYEAMAQEALRGVVKAALKRAAAPEGLPGAHHFYITFKTDAPGVSGPVDLLSKYPDEMTIVLQHQFWDLKVHDSGFEVGLSFRRVPEKLEIPFAAVTGFFDPSVNFGAEFTAEDGESASAEKAPAPALSSVPAEPPPEARPEKAPAPAVRPTRGSASEPAVEPPAESSDDSPKVVSIDAFRKKNT